MVLLKSFIWPGLDERVARLDAAIETFLTTPNPPTLIEGDYVDLLPGLLAERAEDRLTVVYQTASTGYLTPERYAELRRSLERAAADGRPLALVSSRRHDETERETEEGFELTIRVWPEAERLAGNRRLPRELDRLAGRVISSKDNPKLKLVRALQRKKERDETGLFACEGEDLCDAALEAGIEPVELLIAGENVEAELLAAVSTLPHPPRAIGVVPACRSARRAA